MTRQRKHRRRDHSSQTRRKSRPLSEQEFRKFVREYRHSKWVELPPADFARTSTSPARETVSNLENFIPIHLAGPPPTVEGSPGGVLLPKAAPWGTEAPEPKGLSPLFWIVLISVSSWGLLILGTIAATLHFSHRS